MRSPAYLDEDDGPSTSAQAAARISRKRRYADEPLIEGAAGTLSKRPWIKFFNASVIPSHRYTPAHCMALNGNVEMMRYLIEHSAPIDLPCLSTQGPRPIHWACRKGHAAVVQVMLQAGINVNAADFMWLPPHIY
ncbi:hypothetical protein GQX74_009261 [Glossina fuscipes]|nr:hypothetical protein GQX74_009261 [Glossina fuscipes]